MRKQAAWTGVPGSVDRRKRTVRHNVNERAFEELALAKGWAFTKRGWPDFICFDSAINQVIAVEVKPRLAAPGSRMKLLKREQAICMDWLSLLGVVCYVSDGSTLEPYSREKHCNARLRWENIARQRRFNIARGQGAALRSELK